MPTTTINLTGQALSKVDDTNVTITLGGTPLTALLKATSITVGWSGTLADARIASAATWNAKESALTFGTGLTRTVNNVTIDSSVVTLTGAQALSNKTGNISQWTNDSGYLTSLTGAVTSVTGSGNIASSGGATPNITFTGVLPTANGGTGVNIATTALTLGTASSAAGSIVLQNATNANTVTINSGVTSASYSLTLPTAQGGANTYLKNDGAGALSWAAVAGGAALSGLTVATATNTIDNVNYAQVWSWNSLTTEIALTNSSSSITTGSINKIISTSTVGNASKGLEISISGANSTASKTNYGSYQVITNTGSSSTNVACYLSASGGTVNYSIQAPNGNVIIGNTTPGATPFGTSWLDVNGGINACYVAGNARFKVGMGGVNQVTLTDGNSGWDFITTGANPFRFYYNTSTEAWRISGSGKFSNTAGDGTAYLHLKAGTATANTAPLKLTTGTVNTTAEAGTMEYNNTFHLTNSDATRRHIATAPNTTKVTAGAPYANDGYIVINIGGTDFKVMTTA